MAPLDSHAFAIYGEAVVDHLKEIAANLDSIDSTLGHQHNRRTALGVVSLLNEAERNGELDPPAYRPGWKPATRTLSGNDTHQERLVRNRTAVLGFNPWSTGDG
jgi:hypothetical protein